MRILITTGIFPPDIGGPARMVEQLALDLHQKDIEVVILTYGVKDKERPYPVIRENCKLKFAWLLWRLSGQIDIIYTLDLYTPGLLSWFVGKVLRRKRLVVRFAGDSAWETASNQGRTSDDILTFQGKYYGLRVAFLKVLRGRILRNADKVIAVSEFMKTVAEKIGVSSGKVEVIYNSVDFVKVSLDHRLDVKAQLGLHPVGKLIVAGGRLVPWKGLDGLISALAGLRQEKTLSVFKLLIIGDGPDRQRLEKLRDKFNLGDVIIFEGKVPLENIFDYYRAADFFVLNSQYEGLSHMLLEALLLGKPVIASSCGGNPEVVQNEKNGLLVEYNNIGQISEAIKKMLTEEKWQAGSIESICRESLKKFSWREVLEKTIKVFQNV